MRRFTAVLLVLSIIGLSGNLIANEKKYEFNLLRTNTELPKANSDSITLKRGFLFSFEQTLQAKLPVYNNMDFNFSENSDFWRGARIGALIGGVAFAVLASRNTLSGLEEESFLIGAAVGIVLGGLVGGIIATRF
jgi:hypothetical protein